MCLGYFSDFFIVSKKHDKHPQDEGNVSKIFQRKHVSPKLKKSEFVKTTVTHLRHIVRSVQLAAVEVRTQSLMRMQHPRIMTELRSFLGLFNLYCRFIPGYAAIATPLISCSLRESRQILTSFGTEKNSRFADK